MHSKYLMQLFLEEPTAITKIKKKKKNLKREIFLLSLKEYLQQNTLNLKKKNIFLTPDENFVFSNFKVNFFANNPLTIKQLETIIEDKTSQLNQSFGRLGPMLLYFVENIFVDSQPSDFVLGEKGQIFFKLNIIFWRQHKFNEYKSMFGKHFNNPLVKFYPRSFFTRQFVKQVFKTQNFALVYLLEEQTKLINVKDGSIFKINYLNFGVKDLKKILRENHLSYLKLLQNDLSGFQSNLVEQIIDFFTNTIISWLKDNALNSNQKTYLISDLTHLPLFNELFIKQASKQKIGFLVPFKDSTHLNKYNLTRQGSEIDILTALNALS